MTYKNQYLGLDKSAKLRTTFEICLRDVATLRSFDPKEGTLQTTASILFKKLIHELKQSTVVTPGDFSAFHYAISECRIILGGHVTTAVEPVAVPDVQRSPVVEPTAGPVNPSPVKTPRRNVGRRVKSVAQPVA